MELTVQIGFVQLVEAIRRLPAEQRRSIQLVLEAETAPLPPVERKFGTMKGLVVHMADDFDAPLDDFKEYM